MPELVTYLDSSSRPSVFPSRFSNQVYFSHNSRIHFEYTSPYSIKYAIAGTERYHLGGQTHVVSAGNFLVVNNSQDVVCIPSWSEKAISIFIEPALVADVFRNFTSPEESLLEQPFEMTDVIPGFFEGAYPVGEGNLGTTLLRLGSSFSTLYGTRLQFSIDFYVKLASELLRTQQETNSQIQNISSRKRSTREELYRRTLRAKRFLHENIDRNVTLAEIAEKSCLSPYHLHRTFRSSFGRTPQQFHSGLRMETAIRMLKETQGSISDVAESLGFNDIHTFSRSFRRHFGHSPRQARA